MSRLLRIFPWVALVLIAPSCSSFLGHGKNPRQVVRGPLRARPQQPLALTVMSFRPRRAATQPQGKFGFQGFLAYSSIEEIGVADGERVAFDGELFRATFLARYGLSESADIEIEIPFLYATSGFLDSFVESFHEFLGLPDGGRDLNRNDQFDMELSANGVELYRLDEDRIGLQDIPIFLTRNVRAENEHGPGVAIRFGIELPTGSESSGFGNGGLDFGAATVVEKSLGRWTLGAGIDYVVPAQPDTWEDAPGYSLASVFGWELGTEYRWSDSVSLLVQSEWTSRRTGSFEREEIAREIFDLGAGIAWDLGEASRMSLAFHDDVVSASGPDFTIYLTFTTGF